MCKCRSHGTFPLFGLQSSHLNICYYHQDLHRRPLRPGSHPGFYGDRRALLLIGAWSLPRRPGIGHALKRHPFSGLVDSAVLLTKNGPLGALDSVARLNEAATPSYLFKVPTGMLSLEPFSEDQGRSAVHPRGIPPISFLAPYGFPNPLTRTHVRLLGPCFKTGRMGSPQADARSTLVLKHAETARAGFHDRGNDVSMGVSKARAWAATTIRVGPRPEPIGGPALASFSSFPRGTCSLSVSRPYLALDGIYRPIRAAFPNNLTRRQRLVVRQGLGTTRLSPSPAPLSRGLGPGPPLRKLLQTTIRTLRATDSQAGLFPVRSLLLRESFKATLPLTIPRRIFKSSAKDSTRRSVEITLQGYTRDLFDARAAPTTRALGGHRPLLRVGNRATGACVASSPDSDLEAFSHNPAHGSFAPLAFQPSAMTNCANQRFLSY
ncbi:hypothetical protein V6N13_030533 [Hibiscus sabdariffa]